MQRVFSALLFWTLVLTACSTGISAPPTPSPTQTALPGPTPPATVVHQTDPAAGEVTPPTPDTQNCGYQWANQALPELSSSFQEAVRALYPEAQASAYAFGENCIRADGTIARFSAMETDFNIRIQVDDLANESVLGKRIVQVMQIIEAIPAEQIAGPRPGRVSILFQSSTAQDVVNFYINQFKELPSSFNYAEIYEALRALQ